MGRYEVLIPLASVVIPLICIIISIILSPWFNIFNNALSDLGHAVNSAVSPIFNFGLSSGGVLIITTATTIIPRFSKALATSLTLNGYTLILVAVFDEIYNIYGKLHFWVSIAFFISLAISLIIYSIVVQGMVKKALSLTMLMICTTSWILHIFYRIPPGAAIPELISVFIVIPFYIDAVLKSLRTSVDVEKLLV